MKSFILSVLLLCAMPAGADTKFVSAVRYLHHGEAPGHLPGSCSAVVVGPDRALTAAHCAVGRLELMGRTVHGEPIADDLAVLTPSAGQTFAPPYAVLGGLTDDLTLEGYGCDPAIVEDPLPRYVFHRSRRSARYLGTDPHPGLEISFAGLVCGGDSGGAIWASDGRLAGVMTARSTLPELPVPCGYGTPVR